MADLQEHPDGDTLADLVLPVYGDDGVCLTDYGPDPVVAFGGAPRTSEQRQIEAIAACPAGPVLDAWLRGLDLTVLTPAILVEVVAARARMEAHQHAAMLDAVAELATRPEMAPDWSPLAGAPPTHPSVAADELAMRLGWARVSANKAVNRALLLNGMLTATGQALDTGHIDAAKADVIATGLTDLPYQAAHAVETAVLPDAAQCSRTQLEQRVAREVRLADPDGEAGRHTLARRGRRVTHPRRRPHGMASMWVVLAAEDATRIDGVLDHTARAAKALGDPRTLDQLRADSLRDLVVGDVPSSDGPAFEVHLDPPAPVLPTPRRGSDWLVTTTRRQPVRPRPVEPTPTATVIPISDPAPDTAVTEPAPSNVAVERASGNVAVERASGNVAVEPAPSTAVTEPAPSNAPTGSSASATASGAGPTLPAPTGPTPTDPTPSELGSGTSVIEPAAMPGLTEGAPGTAPTATVRRGCGRCSGRPGAEVRVTIAASTLLGLDDEPADLDGYGPIDAVRARALADGAIWRRIVTDPVTDQVLDVGRERYRPPAGLAELVRTRDGTCVAPGCTVPARRADLDHTTEYQRQPGDPPDQPLGRTDADNLGPMCHRHHRLKTDGGFRLRQIQPGLFEWITPAGHRYLVRPGTGRTHDATADPHDASPPF
ncbi:DUF222 domain-containing protein [Cellulomonas sp. ACRRI]|uniref:HNH endonuclease signature motif containing protein n=1 Tax=Cellulomonas sp. ACRRI TaxID=2918188 RepID=UPI001EF1E977|nr:HNH endonuclease signature motif containing protein [Cellulomonas sp. ACRRI]MCG7287788.1 DUF222 domain-containing protein [Cellulomonas sp. ACRRI]